MGSTLRNTYKWDEVQSRYFELCRRAKRADTALDQRIKTDAAKYISANRNEIRRLQEAARDILADLNRLEPLERFQKKPAPLELTPPDEVDTSIIDPNKPEVEELLSRMRADFAHLLDLQREMVSPSAYRPPVVEIRPPTISPVFWRVVAALIALAAALFIGNSLLRSWVQTSYDRGVTAISNARTAQQDALRAIANAEIAQAEATAEPQATAEVTPEPTAEATPEATPEPGAVEWASARDYWQNAINEFTFVNSFFISDYRVSTAAARLSDSYWEAIRLELELDNWDAARDLARRFVEAGVDVQRAQTALRDTYYVPALALYDVGDYLAVRAMLDDMPRGENGELDTESEQLYQTSLTAEATLLTEQTPTDWTAVETLLLPVLSRPDGDANQRALDLIGLSLVRQGETLTADEANESRWVDARAKLEPMRTSPLIASGYANDAVNLYRSTYYLPAAALLETQAYLDARALFEELFALPEGGEIYLDAHTLYLDTFYYPISDAMAAESYTEARTLLAEFIALDAANEGHRETRRLRRESYYLPAQQAVIGGEYDSALTLLEPLFALDPDYADTRTLLTNTYFELGRAAIDRNELVQARSYLESLRAINPAFTDLQTLLSQVYYDLAQVELASTNAVSRWENARPYLDDLYALNPDFRDTYTLLQESYYAPFSTQITAGIDGQNRRLCADTREQFLEVRELRGASFLQDYRDAAWLEHESYYCEVVVSIALNDMEAARENLLLLSSLSPYFRDIESLFNQTYYLPARAALDAEDWETARELLRVLLTRESFYNDAFILLRESYYRPGSAAFAAGDWATARGQLIPLVYGANGEAAIDPDYRDAYDLLRDAYYVPGAAAYANGEWTSARTHLLPLLYPLDTRVPVAPNYGDVGQMVRECYRQPAFAALETGLWDTARAELRPLLFGTSTFPAIDPNYADVQEILRESYYRPAAAALEAGEWEATREYLRPLIIGTDTTAPIDRNYRNVQVILRESYYRPAVAALEAGEWEVTREYLRPLIIGTDSTAPIDRNYRDARILLRESYYRPAVAALEAGEWSAAREYLRPLIIGVASTPPLDREYRDAQVLLRESYYRPGRSAYQQRDWETARLHLGALLRTVSANYRDATYLLRMSYYVPAHEALEGQNWAVARLNFDALYLLDPDFLNTAVLRYQAYFVPGQIALDAEDWGAARFTLRAALERAPNDMALGETQTLINETWYRPAVQAIADENWSVARAYLQPISLASYRDARDLYRNTFIDPIERAILGGDFQAARRALTEFRQAFPSDPQFRELLLLTYTEPLQRAVAAGDWFSAAGQYEQVWAQNPQDADLDLLVAEYPELRAALARRTEIAWRAFPLAGSADQVNAQTSVSSIEITGGGRRMAVADVAGFVGIWTVGSSLPDYDLYTGSAPVADLALDERSEYLAVAVGNDVQLWDLATGQFRRTLTGHTDHINNLAISADGVYLASAGDDGAIRLWTSADWSAEPVTLLNESPVTALAFAPDSSTLAAGLGTGEIVLWDVAVRAITGQTVSGAAIRQIAFHPDGQSFVSVGNEPVVRVYDLNGITVQTFVSQHTDWVRDVTFNGNGSLMATVGADGRLILWDLALGRSINHLEDIPGNLVQVDFSADSSVLLVGTGDGSVLLWSVRGNND